MISMKKNQELFWLLEVLLLTPIALFWMSLASMILGSSDLFNAVMGQPYSIIRGILFTLICPLAAAWFAAEYIQENKKRKGTFHGLAKVIVAISLATIVVVLVYLFNATVPR